MGPGVSSLFFPAIVVSAMYAGYGPSLFAAVLSTASLVFFIVPPYNSFDVGPDDILLLSVFGIVAAATASISSARKRAEDAQLALLDELQGALGTLRKVSDWPVFVDAEPAGGARKVLEHAAAVVGAAAAAAVWEADEEPWVYFVGSLGEAGEVTRHPPAALQPMVESMTGPGWASAPFRLEHVGGRVFFSGIDTATRDLVALVEVVAREVGNSLEQRHLHNQLQQVAVREDRIRVARDLHDGVLQSLTGVRFQLQALAEAPDATSALSDRLLAVERAIAIEQRELRLFIEDLKPAARSHDTDGRVALALEQLRARLGAEWKIPIALRVVPADLSLPASTEQAIRLMVREAIVNALKHAHPSRVSVDVESDGDGAVRIVICDDGRGFAFRGRRDQAALMAANIGPASLCERVESMAGTLEIDSSPTGSRVEISVPLG
jgi:signal transduction histidine kinase